MSLFVCKGTFQRVSGLVSVTTEDEVAHRWAAGQLTRIFKLIWEKKKKNPSMKFLSCGKNKQQKNWSKKSGAEHSHLNNVIMIN